MRRGMKLVIMVATAITAATLTTTSCRREPIHEPFSNYYLQLDGDYEARHIMPTVPKMFEAVFYDTDSHQEVGHSFLGSTGGYIYDLPPKSYEMIVYGLDSDNTKVSGLKNFEEAVASTEKYTDGDTLSFNAPDHLIVARDRKFEIPLLYDRDVVYTLYGYPKTLVETWCVVITGIKGLTNAVSIDLYLTGQSKSKHLGTEEISNNEMTIHVPGSIDKSSNTIFTPFCTFGKIPGQRSILRLSIMDPNQKKIVCYADVTDQFNDPENLGHWINAHFDIEIEPKRDGGMQPSVDEWDEHVEEYDIN